MNKQQQLTRDQTIGLNAVSAPDDLQSALLDICRSQDAKFLIIQERCKSDPVLDALYRCWLIATDTTEDATRAELNNALTRIDNIAGHALAVGRAL